MSKRRLPPRRKGVSQELQSCSAQMSGVQSRCAHKRRKCCGSRRTRARQSARSGGGGKARASSGSAASEPRGRSSSTPASSKVSRMAQMRQATSSGSAPSMACVPSEGSTGKALRGGGEGPWLKRGGPWCGAKTRSQSGELSARSSMPPGKTCAPGRKPWRGERCSSSSRKPSAGGGVNDRAAGPGCVQPAASTTVAACRQLLGPDRRGPVMALLGFRPWGSDATRAPTHRPCHLQRYSRA